MYIATHHISVIFEENIYYRAHNREGALFVTIERITLRLTSSVTHNAEDT